MLTIYYSDKHLFDHDVECYVVFLDEQFEKNEDFKHIEETYYPRLGAILKKHQFFGRRGNEFVLTASVKASLKQFVFIGIGQAGSCTDIELEHLRRATGSAIKQVKKLKGCSVAMVLPHSERYGTKPSNIVKHVMVAAHLASYEFVTFKTKNRDHSYTLDVYVGLEGATKTDALVQAAEHANIIGKAMNHSRHMIDMPGNIVTPTFLADEAMRIGKDTGMKCTVLDRRDAEKLGMGGFLAVDAGSDQDGKFIILDYQHDKNVPTIALVGKGVTFDTGGVSLKPSGAMTGMKYDMSGAAAVLGAMNIIGQIKPKHVNVVGIAPAVENMPSGKSSRQDDIITFMNGKTAEIKSTDAEGRLILADALCYAEKYFEPDVMLDAATLTGACVMALGHYYTALMTKDDELAKRLDMIGSECGDRVWRLPFIDEYHEGNRSNVADIANCGSREFGAGSITAGKFLENFVEKTPWGHLDIAGTADGVPNVSYLGRGATGASIRLFVEFVMAYSK
jgi:leucyl aminopeptidase